MYKDFEGKTEQEAINKAIEELNIGREDFDVEILDNGHRGLFKRGNVKIRVNVSDSCESYSDEEDSEETASEVAEYSENEEFSAVEEPQEEDLEINEELEEKVCSFIDGIVSHMGYSGSTKVSSRKGHKVYVDIDSADSSIIIGRKGKNLDAIQVLVNVFAGKLDTNRKIIVDSEGYRVRHEDQIIKSAFRAAQQVRKTGRSILLDPMNPYERRLVHTALSDVTGVETKSEGDGLYKQVRIMSKRRR